WRPLELPFAFTSKTVGISINPNAGASDTFTGGDIKITSESTDVSLSTEFPTWGAAFTSTLGSLFQQVPGNILSAKTGLDASVVIRGTNANTSLTNTNITSSGSVTVSSKTNAETVANAIATGNGLGTGVLDIQGAVSYGQATSTVTATLAGSTTIN